MNIIDSKKYQKIHAEFGPSVRKEAGGEANLAGLIRVLHSKGILDDSDLEAVKHETQQVLGLLHHFVTLIALLNDEGTKYIRLEIVDAVKEAAERMNEAILGAPRHTVVIEEVLKNI